MKEFKVSKTDFLLLMGTWLMLIFFLISMGLVYFFHNEYLIAGGFGLISLYHSHRFLTLFHRVKDSKQEQ